MTAWNRRGFSLVELLVVVTLVAVLAAILLDRILLYQERAEKTATEQVIAAIRSGLQLQLASHMLQGDRGGMRRVFEQNPLDVLVEAPADYAGVISSQRQPLATLKKGYWYFDQDQRELVYRPNLDGNLEVQASEKILRFRVEGARSAISDAVAGAGIRLVAVVPYKWF